MYHNVKDLVHSWPEKIDHPNPELKISYYWEIDDFDHNL